MKTTFKGDYIRLDNLLKLSGLAATGGEAKLTIQNGEALVNGEVCAMRGKKLFGGEEVRFKGETITVVKQCT